MPQSIICKICTLKCIFILLKRFRIWRVRQGRQKCTNSNCELAEWAFFERRRRRHKREAFFETQIRPLLSTSDASKIMNCVGATNKLTRLLLFWIEQTWLEYRANSYCPAVAVAWIFRFGSIIEHSLDLCLTDIAWDVKAFLKCEGIVKNVWNMRGFRRKLPFYVYGLLRSKTAHSANSQFVILHFCLPMSALSDSKQLQQ